MSEVVNKSLYPEFDYREKTYEVMDDDPDRNWNDKGNITDWFIWDFTLKELKSMKRIQRLSYRDPTYNTQETFCTVQEYIDIAKSAFCNDDLNTIRNLALWLPISCQMVNWQ